MACGAEIAGLMSSWESKEFRFETYSRIYRTQTNSKLAKSGWKSFILQVDE